MRFPSFTMVRLDQLKRNEKTFTELVFYENDFFRSDNFLDLVTAILMNITVEIVRFHDCKNPKWSTKQLKILFAAIARLPKLRVLSIARTNVSLQAVAEVVEKGVQLREMDIWGSNLIGADVDVARLSEAMRQSQLASLYLKKVTFSDVDRLDPLIEACLAELDSLTLEEVHWKPGAVSENAFGRLNLSQLRLRKLSLDTDHIRSLGEGLKGSSLRNLTLSHIPISLESATALAAAVSVNDTLQYLCLYHCDLSDREAAEIAKMLHMNTVLRSLGLSENMIGDEGAVELANALLEPSSSLKVLELEGNVKIQERGLQALLQLSEQSYVLESLHVFPLSRKSSSKEQMDIQKKINASMNAVTRQCYAGRSAGKRPKVWYE